MKREHVLPPERSQRNYHCWIVRRAQDNMTERQVALLGSIGFFWFYLKSNFLFFSDTANLFIPAPLWQEEYVFLVLQCEVYQDYQHKDFWQQDNNLMTISASIRVRKSLKLNLKSSITSIIVSQPSKCLKFMTFREGCFVTRNWMQVLKGQLQRLDKLSLFDRFRHVENGFDIIFWKFVFVFLL